MKAKVADINSAVAGPKPGWKRRRVVRRVSSPTMEKQAGYRN